ncbi:MAG: DUF1211 domain-containing protein [Chitinophagaceae bacterium]|nr:DUF1211 domain-containing protein [Chitinophagaceae bacterium]
MIRKKVFGPLHQPHFRERGKEILRIEALSDAVFAFSVSLLVVALEVPQTFHELEIILQGAVPFFATVAMIFLFWYQQYKFFRRYGLNDRITIFLNLAYLAVILFYVYPLKFLFSLLLFSWTGINLFPEATEKGIAIMNPGDFSQLIMLFSAGYCMIWLLLFFMYQRVLYVRKKLELNQFEVLFTRKERSGAILNAAVGIAAILMVTAGWEILSGICYLFIPVLLIVNARLYNPKTSHTEK